MARKAREYAGEEGTNLPPECQSAIHLQGARLTPAAQVCMLQRISNSQEGQDTAGEEGTTWQAPRDDRSSNL